MGSQTTRRNALALAAAAATCLAMLAPTAARAASDVLVVDDDLACAGSTYKTIGAAVTAAQPGDTIRVCTGTFKETVHVDKSLNFEGAQAGNPGILVKHDSQIIAPNGAFVVEDGADNVTINGFLLRRAGSNGSGAAAVESIQGAVGLDIINNSFRDNGVSVRLGNADPTSPVEIHNNAFQQNTDTDIVIDGVAHGVTVNSNVFKNNGGLAIDFAGDLDELSTGVGVSYNKTVNERLLSISGTDHAIVLSNRNVRAQSGAAVLDAGGNYSLLIKGNRIGGGDIGIALTADAGAPSISTTLRTNVAAGQRYGALVTDDNVSAWLTRNSFNGGEIGILVDSGRGNQITYNGASGGDHDCVDLTLGVDGNPLNLWRQNDGYGDNSTPANICRPIN